MTVSRRKDVWRNWGRNQTAKPALLARPVDETEVARLVDLGASGNRTLRAVGSGHSFSPIVPTDGILVDVGAMNEIVSVDRAHHRVTVEAGITLHDLNRKLWNLGLALPNLGDIDSQTIAGATATGTHGTGAGHHTISSAIVGMRIVTADASVLDCDDSTRPDVLDAARVGLGALGIVTRLTLQCVPAFHLHAVETTLDIDELLESFDDTVAANDHVEFYWFPHTRTGQLKVNNRTDTPGRPRNRVGAFVQNELIANGAFELINRLGRRRAGVITRVMPKAVTPGERVEYTDAAHRVFCSARRVRFIEMEYALPRAALLTALDEVRRAIDGLSHPVPFPIEARVLAGDEIPLSPAHGRETGYLAVHLYRGTPHEEYFGAVEAIMAAHDGRPHWGKMHTLTAAELAPMYPRWDDFITVRDELDPDGRFANGYLRTVLDG